jgi:acetoacetate decarboxylase
MTEDEVKKLAFAMPLTSPAFPCGPYRFVNREYMIITYRTDPDALRAVIPGPLEMAQPIVKYEFIRMPEGRLGRTCGARAVSSCARARRTTPGPAGDLRRAHLM